MLHDFLAIILWSDDAPQPSYCQMTEVAIHHLWQLRLGSPLKNPQERAGAHMRVCVYVCRCEYESE